MTGPYGRPEGPPEPAPKLVTEGGATHTFAMPRVIPEALYEPFRREEYQRPCDVPGCPGHGQHRAPKSRERLDDYYWFCLDHVREYNASWDYFHDMSEAEIEAIRRNDTVWQRPSWPLGADYHQYESDLIERIRRMFGLGGEDPRKRQGDNRNNGRPRSEEEKALAVFDLDASASFTEIKTRYKKLAKKLHPDANGGDQAAEERLKAVNQAYATLKKSFGPAPSQADSQF